MCAQIPGGCNGGGGRGEHRPRVGLMSQGHKDRPPPLPCPALFSQGAQPDGRVMPPPASSGSKGSAGPALPSAPLALAKACSLLLLRRLNKANQSHSFSVCLCGPLGGPGGWGRSRPSAQERKGEGREAKKGKEGIVNDPEGLWGLQSPSPPPPHFTEGQAQGRRGLLQGHSASQ